MTALTALARAIAVASGEAAPVTTVRHLHCAERPMVFVPLAMAGEANAPLAAMVGRDRERPHTLLVPQPRNRDQRFVFAAELAGILLPYFQEYCSDIEVAPPDRSGEARTRYADAPQILVPNPGGIAFTRLFGRLTRFRRTTGQHAVVEGIPELGQWLTFFADRADHPGSCLMMAMTSALSLHWATGQSMVEDAHLPALMAWIDPSVPGGGAALARETEDPRSCPPAGPATDPEFDNTVLAPAMERYERTADPSDLAAMRDAVVGQLEGTWRLMWRALDLLGGLPAGKRVADRWARDRDAFTQMASRVAECAPPAPRRDGAVAAAARLRRWERALTGYALERAWDDPLVMAEYRLTGEAFSGVVIDADRLRIDATGRRRVLRPWITVQTCDRVRAEPGASWTSPTRPAQRGVIVEASGPDSTGETRMIIELSGGMGRALTPLPGSVPEVGERVDYTCFGDGFSQPGSLPEPEETPWTHGGPPEPWSPGEVEAVEDWS